VDLLGRMMAYLNLIISLQAACLVDSLTIDELMRDHLPKLDPKDTIHAACSLRSTPYKMATSYIYIYIIFSPIYYILTNNPFSPFSSFPFPPLSSFFCVFLGGE
jgi:hypothetical protein